jgi:hypothetical protein
MHAFDVLGDPVRRRILELLAERELNSGAIVEVIQAEFGSSSLRVVDEWLERFRRFWDQKLDALATEIARGSGAAVPRRGKPPPPRRARKPVARAATDAAVRSVCSSRACAHCPRALSHRRRS